MKNSKILFLCSFAFLCLMALGANAKVEIFTLPNGDVSITPHNSNNGCTVLYDKDGKLINKGSSCKFGDVLVAGLTMQAHLKEKNQNSRPQGEFADGDAGGPDFWEIAGVKNNNLGLKVAPDKNADFIVEGLPNGTVLRNLGCQLHGGERWCKVSVKDHSSEEGWVRNIWLKESSGQRSSW